MIANIPQEDYDFVKKIAYKYFIRSNYYVELEDLLQEGLLAYIKCKEKYDDSKNNFYMGYAYLRISGAIKDFIGKNSPRGGATVRPNSSSSTREMFNFSSMGLDGDDFEDTKAFNIEDELIRMQCAEEFERYIKTLTPLEQGLLYDYFIQQLSIVKLAELSGLGRGRIKKIITSCLEHLKRYFKVELIV